MHQISRLTAAVILAIGAVAAAACDDDDDEGPSGPVSTTFTVTIENVSTQGTLAVTRLNGVVPLSPGVWAVYTNLNPLFLIDQPVVESLERLAEDGDNSAEGARIAGLTAALRTDQAPRPRVPAMSESLVRSYSRSRAVELGMPAPYSLQTFPLPRMKMPRSRSGASRRPKSK